MTYKIIYKTARRKRIKTVYSVNSLRAFIKYCWRNCWLARATDGEYESGAVFINGDGLRTYYTV